MGNNLKEDILWALREIKANKEIKSSNRKALEKPIRVGFIVQMPEVWDKRKPLFEAMMEDPDFSPMLIVVPEYNLVTEKIGDYGSELSYYQGLYGGEHLIIAKNPESGEYADLEPFGFHYVFYERPYEHYLPELYHTKNVCRYARTCYIPYYFNDKKAEKAYFKTNFFRYLTYFFAGSEEESRIAKTKSMRKNICLGYPDLDRVERSFDNPKEGAVLYTPRWIEEDEYGGSSFYEYKDAFVSLKAELNHEVIFRPHPLTFGHAISTGLMTEETVKKYLDSLTENGIEIDQNKNCGDTFLKTGILVTDMSSIIINFFLTGKPIVLCRDLSKIPFTETYSKIIESSYEVKNWKELVKRVDLLLKGEDPLKEKRLKAISEITGGGDSVRRIMNELKGKNK